MISFHCGGSPTRCAAPHSATRRGGAGQGGAGGPPEGVRRRCQMADRSSVCVSAPSSASSESEEEEQVEQPFDI